MTWGRVYWPTGLIVVAFAFLIPEFIALATNIRNTLSWYCWYELGDLNSVPAFTSIAWALSMFMWLVFVVEITAHIWFRHWLLP